MNNRLKTLYPKLADGSISQEGLDWLRLYFETGNPEELLVLLRAELEAADDTAAETSAEQVMFDRIYSGIVAQRFSRGNSPKVIYKLWPRIAIAAAAVAAIVLSIWMYTSRNLNTNGHPELVSGSHDITPGKNTATLSFNGRSMQLSEAKTGVKFDDDKLTYNDGSPLSLQKGTLPAGEHIMVTATTPRGGTYEFVLQDGTRVWLNADSKLEFYPNYKGKSQRIVKLEGEGYFEVAKDKAHPFIVESAGQKVEVLGTHFNINAYKDEKDIKTTLLEGSVRVAGTSRGGKETIVLKPNQQSILANNTLTINEADPNATAWVNGRFSFYKTPLSDVMKQLGRWYDVEVVYPDGVPDIQFTGGLTRNINASEVLLILKKTGVKFKIEGKKVIVSK